MTRTILYYPTISIPNTEWLRKAILYFDEVASIAPQVLWDPDKKKSYVPLTSELEYLWREGVYKPIDPEKITIDPPSRRQTKPQAKRQVKPRAKRQGWPVAHQLREEFEVKVKKEGFKAGLNSKFVRIHRGKMHDTLLQFLEDKGLLKYDAPTSRKYTADWFLVEERTALLYMSMLAQALSDIHPKSMVPGTDRPEYENLIYGAPVQEKGLPCIETRLMSVLPVPRQDVPFSDILDFKRRRQDELLYYRTAIDNLQKELKKTETYKDVTEALTNFEEEQTTALSNLIKALNDAKLATIFGSVKTFINANPSFLLGAVLVSAGAAGTIATLPISLSIGLVTVAGSLAVGSYLVDERNKRRASEGSSPFAYLYHAQQEGITHISSFRD